MSNLMTFEAMFSATSSPASVDGVTPCDLQGGPTTNPSGLDRALANHSLAPLGDVPKELGVIDIYGPYGVHSYKPAALAMFLGSRLPMPVLGSMKCGAAIIPAGAVGADHIRQRIWFHGNTDSDSESRLPIHAEAPGMPGRSGEQRGLGPQDGLPDDVACLRAFGNAIVPQVAAAFISAACHT